MNLVIKTALAVFVASLGFGPVSSFAQDASCSCATAYQGPANPIGSIRSANGDVMVSQAAGYSPAKAGNALDFGSRVVVGAKGTASVLIGGCNLDVPANSSLDVSRFGNNICLKLVGFEQTAAIQPSGGGGGFGPPEAIFAGALLTTGVLAATQDDDNGVSR
ncbi:hypothetical protein [Mesorhizobium sp. M7A.F.Ca.US.008.03.1.1]|uniref:hypothetical protein n=1 Tax=Mesorhizobium sp. M7A.F.Ca.US.008.03.1.1 TaxID=2496742 RepID=UPI000FCB7431|nr:hypothetical protein [Mesorhizobium sp. M7A.F.Ca.US.008.03.1.1]RUW62300.1 hypothetical protein EOA16_08680 [Mesorhizobium sp. M7A.F.Ca.US.008.03.1.1]